MVKIEAVLDRITAILNRVKIPYMLIGGLAVSFQGEPRFSKDIDLVIAIEPDNLELFLRLLAKHKFHYHENEIKMLIKVSNRFVIIDPTDTFRIDFWLPKTIFEKQAFSRRKKEQAGKRAIFVIRPEDLILFKLLAGRYKDKVDAYSVLVRQKGKLDRKYLKAWALSLNKEKELAQLEKGKWQ